MESKTLSIWKKFAAQPGGKWAFSKLICFKAPYFRSVKPLLSELRPQYCEVHVKKRRSVLNHLGTVHAIAMCNMAELAAGTMTEVTIPSTHRWIPKGMTVQYLQKAESDLVAVATPASTLNLTSAGEYAVSVSVSDHHNNQVLLADVTMWVSPKK